MTLRRFGGKCVPVRVPAAARGHELEHGRRIAVDAGARRRGKGGAGFTGFVAPAGNGNEIGNYVDYSCRFKSGLGKKYLNQPVIPVADSNVTAIYRSLHSYTMLSLHCRCESFSACALR
jgi:hypothetical protein